MKLLIDYAMLFTEAGCVSNFALSFESVFASFVFDSKVFFSLTVWHIKWYLLIINNQNNKVFSWFVCLALLVHVSHLCNVWMCNCCRQWLAQDDCRCTDWLRWSQLLCCSATVTGGIVVNSVLSEYLLSYCKWCSWRCFDVMAVSAFTTQCVTWQKEFCLIFVLKWNFGLSCNLHKFFMWQDMRLVI